MDAKTAPLGENEQFGVEEPLIVLDQRQERLGDIAPDRLEPALGVGEPRPQRAAEQDVVAPRDEFAFRATLRSGVASQP